MVSQIAQRAVPVRVGCAHREHFAELVIGNRDRKAGAAGGAVLDAAQANVEITARCRGIDARETDLDEARRPAETRREQLRDLDVEANDMRRIIRICLDVRRSAFGITTPPKNIGGLSARGAWQQERKTHEYRTTEGHRCQVTGYREFKPVRNESQ
jgi:hypothetical protein